jgi:hypothetical protein
MLVTVSCLDVAGDVVIDYKAAWDSEIKYDPTMIEVDECDERWSYITGGDRLHEGVGSGVQSIVVPESRHDGIIRIRFRFTSDTAWSDEDGIYDTDGAIIIDSLTVSDTTGVILPTELFEVESVGDTITVSGNWVARAMPGYGDFAGLFPGAQVVVDLGLFLRRMAGAAGCSVRQHPTAVHRQSDMVATYSFVRGRQPFGTGISRIPRP